jgi:DNA-binding LacI/PurR family transcriptional regulator
MAITKENIEKINSQLHYGDKAQIARFAGLSKVTVNSFFNGQEKNIHPDNVAKILDNALALIEARQVRIKGLVQKTVEMAV